MQDGSNEVLKVNGQDIPLVPGTTIINGITYTVAVDSSGNATVTVTDPTAPGWTEAEAETLLGNTTYVNNATPPTAGPRSVTLNSVTPVDNTTSTPATTVPVTGQGTTIAPTPNTGTSSPLAGETLPNIPGGSTVDSLTFTVTGVSPTTGNPSETLNIGGNVIPLVPGTTTYGTSPDQVTYTVTVVDGVATVVATPETNYPAATAQTLTQGVTYTNSATPATGPRTVSLTNMAVDDGTNPPVSTPTPGVGSTLVLNNTNTPPVLTPFTGTDNVPTPTGSNTIQTLTFGVSGVRDGANEVLKVNGQNIPLVDGTTIINGITYTVAVVNGNATVTATDPTPPGWTEGEAETLVQGVTYVNNATSPTAGERGLTLQSVTQVTDAGVPVTPTTITGVSTTATPAGGSGPTTPMSGDTLPDVVDGSSVDKLTFEVTGVQDGANEVLTFGTVPNTTTVPLVDGNVPTANGVTPAGTYAVTVVNGTATVVFTPTTNLTEAEAITLTQGTTYTNTAAPPTPGPRAVSLTSLDQEAGTGSPAGTVTTSPATNIGSTVLVSNNSNTAPTVSGDHIFAVNEGSVYTLTAADLAATDAQLAAGSLSFKLTAAPTQGTLFRDSNGNSLVNTGEALTQNSTFTQAEITAGSIKYRHGGNEPAAETFKVTVSDGQATTAESTVTVTVNQANDAPTLVATTASNLSFTEGGNATPLFTSVTVNPIEAGQTITSLKLTVAGLRDGAAEELVNGVTHVALTDSNSVIANGVTYAGSVTGSTATVTVTHAGLDAAAAKALIEALAYNNTNTTTPTSGNRVVTLTEITDNGGTANGGQATTLLSLASSVTVAPTNDAPTLTGANFNVLEGGSFTLSPTQINAADVDTALNLLTFTLTAAPTLTNSKVYIDGNSDGQLTSGEALTNGGNFTYGQLNTGKVRYQHDGGEFNDVFSVNVSDGTVSATTPLTLTVMRDVVNDAPSIATLSDATLNYPVNSGPQLVDTGTLALVTDLDSANFNGGSLRVAITTNHSLANDVLSIKHVGTGATQIGVSGSNVTYNNVPIGAFTGGTGANDLVVTFIAAATPEAVSALVSAIQFQNSETAPLNTRTISFTLSDGAAGGVAQPVPVNVAILTATQPAIQNGAGFYIAENTALVTALSATDPQNLVVTFSISPTSANVSGTTNEDASKFSINPTTGLLSFANAPDFEAPTDATAPTNAYRVVVRATNTQNSFSESPLTVNVVNVVDETATVGDLAGPAFGFATVNGTSLVLTYTDASNLEATNIPATTAFTVSGNTVNTVAVNSTAKTVTLTLGTAVVSTDTVTVAYNDPSAYNDAAAIQDSLGNDAATLVATTVTNTTTPVTPPSSGGGGGGGGSTTPTTPAGGSTVTTDPATGNTTVVNNGTTPTVVPTPPTGGTVTSTGTGPTTVTNPGGVVTVNNTGSGTVTTGGITGSTTVNTTGGGSQAADLSGVPPGSTVTIQNNGTGTVNVSNLPDGVIVIIAGAGPVTLNDADGANQSTENRAPAKTGGTLGDGNGDQVADALQSNVTSTPFLSSPTPISNPGNAPQVYVSLVADSRAGVIDTTDANSATLSNVQQRDRPADAPADLQMPLGMLSFTANVGSAGITETFSLFVDASLAVNGYWKNDSLTNTWVNLASSAYGGQIVSDGGKTRLDFQITDGGRFDSDGLVNGSISDPGAVGYQTSAPADPADTDNDQFPDVLEAANGMSVGIKDNDVFGSSKFFAMQLYRDILYREADSAGLANWIGGLDAGKAGVAGGLTYEQVAAAFLASPEFQDGAGAIAHLYFGLFERMPDAGGILYWVQQFQSGIDMQHIAAGFTSSAEFAAKYPDPSQYIQSIYTSALGRAPNSTELSQWTTAIAGGATAAALTISLTTSDEFTAQSHDKVSVSLDYLGLLGRPSEPGGFEYWLMRQTTSQSELHLTEQQVINGFLNSTEYHDRFLPSMSQAEAMATLVGVSNTQGLELAGV